MLDPSISDAIAGIDHGNLDPTIFKVGKDWYVKLTYKNPKGDKIEITRQAKTLSDAIVEAWDAIRFHVNTMYGAGDNG